MTLPAECHGADLADTYCLINTAMNPHLGLSEGNKRLVGIISRRARLCLGRR